MLAQAIEYYGAPGAVNLCNEMSMTDLEYLMDCTYEYRRDPKERQARTAQKKARKQVQKMVDSYGREMTFKSLTGDTKTFDMSLFGY